MTPIPSSFTERCHPASDFLLGHFRVFGIFLGILFTKNALQSVLQGISAERTRFELVVRNDPYVGLANRWFQPLTHLSSPLWKGYDRILNSY